MLPKGMTENMKTYRTSEVAAIIGVHPNTVRLYEKIGFISPPDRLSNGYRSYSELHISQMRLARTAMHMEVLQNGLRKKAVEIARLSALLDFDAATKAAEEYSSMIDKEIFRARSAISSVEKILGRSIACSDTLLTRKQAAAQLGITSDTLRNWEMNGLVKIKRMQNGYRVYNAADMEKLTVIRTLRCANYSLSAILRLMNNLSADMELSVSDVLNTPSSDEEIISVCDRLLEALAVAKEDACSILSQLIQIKKQTLHLNTNL